MKNKFKLALKLVTRVLVACPVYPADKSLANKPITILNFKNLFEENTFINIIVIMKFIKIARYIRIRMESCVLGCRRLCLRNFCGRVEYKGRSIVGAI
jgi:hypothetical protein